MNQYCCLGIIVKYICTMEILMLQYLPYQKKQGT